MYIRWITTYNFYTITIDIQVTVLGRFFVTKYIIWSGTITLRAFFDSCSISISNITANIQIIVGTVWI